MDILTQLQHDQQVAEAIRMAFILTMVIALTLATLWAGDAKKLRGSVAEQEERFQDLKKRWAAHTLGEELPSEEG